MRLSLLLFTCLCITCRTYAQSFIRLKNLQFGPSLSIHTKVRDSTIALLGPSTKDPQRFPNWNVDTMRNKTKWWFITSPTATGVHVSLLTTWQFYSQRKKGYDDRKEWKVGIEYSTYDYKKWQMTGRNSRQWERPWNDVSFKRTSQHMALYSDFTLKSKPKKRAVFYAGLGGYLAYSVAGSVVERKDSMMEFKTVSTEKIEHATHTRRDIAILVPAGFELWGSRSISRVGMNVGMRPGVVFIKEETLPVFTTPVIAFTVRLIYNLH